MRVALFGGSFDPPHFGHIKIAKAAKAALKLDGVLMAPVGRQPLKGRLQSSCFEDRLQMVALAVLNEDGIEASDIDAPFADGRPNYTWDTLKRLRSSLAPDVELFFLMGADSLKTFKNWRHADELLFAAEFIIAARPGFSLGDLTHALPSGIKVTGILGSSCSTSMVLTNHAGMQSHIHLLPNLSEDVSATEVRAALRRGREEQCVVPEAVLNYIRTHNLYQ
jgi:nicotinate-nucleotide adenylyltransferase